MAQMEPSEFKWDQRTQKLTRTYSGTEKNKQGTVITEVRQTFDKGRSAELLANLKQQKENISKWYNEQKEIKDMADDTSKIPNFEQIKKVIQVINFTADQRVQAQFPEAEKNLKLVAEDYRRLLLVLPQKL